jgi:GT2 family glycosyltransferase
VGITRLGAMTLSILIVNWNSRDLLRKCLQSVRETCGHLAPQVVVVDGGSFDGSSEMAASEFPEVEFIQSPDNLGFGRCNNLGFQSVVCETLLLLNPDTELQPGAVDALAAALDSQPHAGITGALLLNVDGSSQLASVHHLPTAWNAAIDCDWLRKRWWRKHLGGNEGRPIKVEAVSGACMLMKSSTFRDIGGFDPRFFMYAEDMDLCFRVHHRGMHVFHVPSARVLHHGGGSSQTRFSKFSAVMIREALRTYLAKNHGASHALRYRFLIAIAAILRLPLLAVTIPANRLLGRKFQNSKNSLRKWWAVLSWSLGFEKWSKEHFKTHDGHPKATKVLAPPNHTN